MIFGFLNNAKKQPTVSETVKTITLDLDGMHCTSCSLAIDGELEDTPGVVDSRTTYASQKTTVTFNQTKTSKEDIIQVIQNLGYRVK